MTGIEYNELRVAVGWQALTEQQAIRGLDHSTFITVARDGEKAVGMGRVLFDFGYTAYIADIIVLPEYQRKGIGESIVRTLMKKVIDSSQAGDRIMFALNSAKKRECFYENLGFLKRPNDFDGHGMSVWVTAGDHGTD
ncbi:MAG: GNAT family N-acetyltransferase [Eubacteriales bacterium]|nr:GNAT family N-acetyltransferase [Eubacteriales bacterium]